MVMEKLMEQEYDELGLNVSGDELYDVLLGDNMSPSVRQMFTDPATGTVDKDQCTALHQTSSRRQRTDSPKTLLAEYGGTDVGHRKMAKI